MSEPLLVASGLSLLAAALHGILGETAIFHQARANPLPPFRLPRALRFLTLATPAENSALHWAYLRASWHFLTLDFIVSTILFGMAASSASPALENVVRVTAAPMQPLRRTHTPKPALVNRSGAALLSLRRVQAKSTY